MQNGDKQAYPELRTWLDSIRVDDDGKPLVPPTIDFTDRDLLWRLIMRGGLAKFHTTIHTLCTEWGFELPDGSISTRDADLFSVDGDMNLAMMQRSMAVGF